MRHMDGECCLAEPAHAVNRADRDIAARRAQYPEQLLHLRTAARKVRDVRWKLMQWGGATSLAFCQQVEDGRVGDLLGNLIDAAEPVFLSRKALYGAQSVEMRPLRRARLRRPCEVRSAPFRAVSSLSDQQWLAVIERKPRL
jgi:hypothetical protein